MQDPKKQVLNIETIDDGFAELLEVSEENEANVISFVGDTRSGKSTFIKYLIGDKEAAPVVASEETDDSHEDFDDYDFLGEETKTEDVSHERKPTTSNINFYKSKLGELPVIYLDVEGRNAGSVLPVTEQHMLESILEKMKLKKQEYFEIRNRTVAEKLPKIAYISSHIVVLVSQLNIGNADYKKQVMEFAVQNAVNGVLNAEKPCLLLLSNLQKFSDGKNSVKRSTDLFFSTHDESKSLLNYYNDVKVLEFPLMTDEKSIKLFENKVEKALKPTIIGMLNDQRNERKIRGTVYSEIVWTKFFHKICQRVNKNDFIQIGTLLTYVMLPSDSEIKKVFGILAHFDYLPYEFTREYCLTLLAGFICRTQTFNYTLKPEVFYAKKQVDLRTEKVKSLLKQALNELDAIKPCQATKFHNKQHILCTQVKSTHPKEVHVNPSVLEYTGNALSRSLKSGFGRILSYMGGDDEDQQKFGLEKQPLQWDGKFQYEDPHEKDYVDKFWEMYKMLIGDEKNHISIKKVFLLQLEIVQRFIRTSKTIKKSRYLNLKGHPCLICQRKPANDTLSCGHSFCHECLEVANEIDEMGAVNGILDESVWIKPGLCFICFKK